MDAASQAPRQTLRFTARTQTTGGSRSRGCTSSNETTRSPTSSLPSVRNAIARIGA